MGTLWRSVRESTGIGPHGGLVRGAGSRARAVLEVWADFCAEAVPNSLLMDLGRTICPNFERPGEAGHADATSHVLPLYGH